MSTLKTRLLAAAVCGILPFGAAQKALGNLVVNGDFEVTTAGNGQMGFNTDATGWTTSGYSFLFAPGTADTSGANGQYGGVSLWGPGNGALNGLPAMSPSGGNFVAADSTFQVGAISQTIHGLTPGQTYQVGFWWGGAQQFGYNGPSSDNWTVSLGADSQTTPTTSLPSHGFSGWMYQTFDYTATGTSEVLSFLAAGTPSGVPPFAVLDGVTLQSVPEAAPTAALLGLASAGLGMAARLRRRR